MLHAQAKPRRVVGSLRAGVIVVLFAACAALVSGGLENQPHANNVAAAPTTGNEWYVSPNGTARGTGSISNPWDLQTAFNGPSSVQPGDTIWLRGGTYGSGASTLFTCNLAGTQSGSIIVRQYPGERAIVDGGIEADGPWTTFWGFEITNSSTNRSVPRDQRPAGLSMYGRGEKVINMNIHDTGHPGIGFWNGVGDGGEIYGTLIWHNGLYEDGSWIRGSAIYAQNQDGSRYISDNIAFRNFTTGGKAYTEGAYADGFDFEGNAMFDNGEWNMFGSTMTTPMRRLRVVSNYTYRRPGDDIESVQFGYYSNTNDDAVVQDNYFVGDTDRATLYMKNWPNLTVTGNTLVSRNRTISELDRSPGATVQWNTNTYYEGSSAPFSLDGSSLSFTNWRSQTGYDANSTYNETLPAGVRVFVRPNRYEPGRANIIVYNWELDPSVQADVSNVLPVGTQYEVRDAQNFSGDPVATGTYTGDLITLPMNLTTVAPYIGTVTHRPPASHTAPEFAVFVLIATSSLPTYTPTETPTPTVTYTPSATFTITSTRVPTRTPSDTRTPTSTRTSTVTRTPTITPTPTITRTPSPTLTFTPSRTPTSTSSPTPSRTPVPSCFPLGDINRDGIVDLQDFLLLKESFGVDCTRFACPGDINGDGAVTVSDLLILKIHFDRPCP